MDRTCGAAGALVVTEAFRFDRFVLRADDRRLALDGRAVPVSSRYFDALLLLVREAGTLVPKDRFMMEVWRGVPVTDEALTQCIRTLRRVLGDEAAAPRFIETVPKHGYRFVAAVSVAQEPNGRAPSGWRVLRRAGAGMLGGGAAGLVGGMLYGFVGAAQPHDGAPGGASIVLVLTALTVLVALVGGGGVALGIAAGEALRGAKPWWIVAGGASGGFVTGGIAKLLGLDAFRLILGRSPGDFTGAGEGAVLGASVGLAVLLARRGSSRRRVGLAALVGGAAGGVIPLAGGRLMGGSLDLLAHAGAPARFSLDPLGTFAGEAGFGPVAQAASGACEGALFAGCIAAAMLAADRGQMSSTSRP